VLCITHAAVFGLLGGSRGQHCADGGRVGSRGVIFVGSLFAGLLTSLQSGINEPVETIVENIQTYMVGPVVLLGRVDAGTTPAATNSQWVFQTSVDVNSPPPPPQSGFNSIDVGSEP
jgi:hypothetical protein